jgi:hypothetical protein
VDFVQQPPGHPAPAFPEIEAGRHAAKKAAFEAAEAKVGMKSLKTVLQKLSPDVAEKLRRRGFRQHHGRSADSRQAGFSRLDQGRPRVHRHPRGERHVSWLAGFSACSAANFSITARRSAWNA